MSKSTRHALVLAGLFVLCMSALGAQKTNPFVGRWALTIPGGGAGWLGVEEKGGSLAASILWGGGSVEPVTTAKVEGYNLILTRIRESGRGSKKTTSTETITATCDGNDLKLTTVTKRPDGSETKPANFTGKRIPALPAKPDLSKVKFGKPIVLFDGKNMDAWKLTDPRAKSGWSVENGILVNKPVQPPDTKQHVAYGNLRTVAEFEDFKITLEVNVGKGENSGVYLRGLYEVQVCDSHGRPLDPHNMGAIYSRITPTVDAEKPAGEWQTMELTLVDRHATVVLNGKKIIDNEPLLGCTGGALTSDEFAPGPIYLQGDHTGIKYRNIVITRAFKSSNLFVGRWALTIPNVGAGWLGVEEKGGKLSASILWGGGSVLPINAVKVEGDKLILTRVYPPQKGDMKTGSTETITATLGDDDDTLKLTTVTKRGDNSVGLPVRFTGKRIPPLPAQPDLSKVKFGTPIKLFDGTSLDGWKLVNPADKNGWSVEDGILINNPVQELNKPHVSYGNLRTVAEFEDFKLTLEVNVGTRENSGVYLRGIYEVQVCDSYVKGLDSHNMGAIYSRVTPAFNAEKPPGTWQPLEITLVDRHVTVLLNTQKIIDNQPLLGCTGGALTSDEFKPGPIYLQGDHTGIKYRNIVLTPVVK